MTELESKIKDICEMTNPDNFAFVSPNDIIANEHARASVAKDKDDMNGPSFVYNFSMAALNLFTLGADIITVSTAADQAKILAIKDGKEFIPNYEEKTKPTDSLTRLVIMTYYLLRFYAMAGNETFIIKRDSEDFLVFVEDRENPGIWAAHRVV